MNKISKSKYFQISPLKLAILSFFTLGIYQAYWFYKQWKSIKIADKSNIKPFWRMIFIIYYIFPLFKRMDQSAKKESNSDLKDPVFLGAVYIFANILGSVSDRIFVALINISSVMLILFWISLILGIVPLYIMQKSVQSINASQHRLNKPELAIVFIGIIFFLLVILGSIAILMG